MFQRGWGNSGEATIFEDHEDSRRVWKWCSSNSNTPPSSWKCVAFYFLFARVNPLQRTRVTTLNLSRCIRTYVCKYTYIYVCICIFVHIIVSRASSFTIIADSRMKLPFPNRVSPRRYVLIPVHCDWESECQSSSISLCHCETRVSVWTFDSLEIWNRGRQFFKRRIERETKLFDRESIFRVQLPIVAWRPEFARLRMIRRETQKLWSFVKDGLKKKRKLFNPGAIFSCSSLWL